MALSANPAVMTDFANDSDADLLAYMAMRTDDEANGRLAFAEFHQRHVAWLLVTVRRAEVSRLLRPGYDAEDVCYDALARAYDRAHTFDAAGETDRTTLRRRARAWLAMIATNLLRDTFDQLDPVGIEDCELLAANDDSPPSPLPEEEIIRDELERLPERELDVVLEWGLHYKPGATHQRLPNEESRALARKWGTTPSNIRMVRSRVFKRIKEALLERSGEKRRTK